jgi:hypothetical protein
MKTIIVIIVLLVACTVSAQTRTELIDTWTAYGSLQVELMDSTRAQIAEALLEPDLCLHRENKNIFERQRDIKTPIAEIRKKLAKQRKTYEADKKRYVKRILACK